MISVRADTKSAIEYLKHLERRDLPRVIGRTLNRTMANAKSQSSRFLRNRINLKKSVIDKSIYTRRSNEIQNISALTLDRAWFELRWTGRPIPLRDYAANATKSGVSFKVSKAGRRRKYIRDGNPAFILENKGGHVFVRVGAKTAGVRQPIHKVFGPSVPQFAVTRRERSAIIESTRRFWAEELTRNIRFALHKR